MAGMMVGSPSCWYVRTLTLACKLPANLAVCGDLVK